MAGTGFLGYGATCATVEAFTRLHRSGVTAALKYRISSSPG
jgi:hypothetical protein